MIAPASPRVAAGARHRGPPLLAVAIVFTTLFVASLVVSTAMAGGEHFPSPFQPEALSNGYFAQHAEAVRVGAFLQLGSAVPLGIFTATVVSQLRFLGLKRFSMARNERGFLSAGNHVSGGRYDQAVLGGLA
jgi:ABC-type Fe3+ transport system permease subunit